MKLYTKFQCFKPSSNKNLYGTYTNVDIKTKLYLLAFAHYAS